MIHLDFRGNYRGKVTIRFFTPGTEQASHPESEEKVGLIFICSKWIATKWMRQGNIVANWA